MPWSGKSVPSQGAASIISTGTFLQGPSWLSWALLVIASAGLAVLSADMVLQLVLFRRSVAAGFRDPGRAFGLFAIAAGMYSVATAAFGKAAHLAFMGPLSRVMLWVAVAVAVAGAFVVRILDQAEHHQPAEESRLPAR